MFDNDQGTKLLYSPGEDSRNQNCGKKRPPESERSQIASPGLAFILLEMIYQQDTNQNPNQGGGRDLCPHTPSHQLKLHYAGVVGHQARGMEAGM